MILVTGATDGIGKQTARDLIARGKDVVIHGRTDEKALRTAKELGASGIWSCDLSSLAQIRARFPALPAGIDVVVNNAGLMTSAPQQSAEGHELTFAVNHLAPFLLTKLLLERGGLRRIVNVASQVHTGGDLDTLGQGSGYAAYSVSKLANVLFTFELARRLPAARTTANCLHPGVVSTKLLRQAFGGMAGSESLEEGAATSVFLASSPEVEGVTGKYFRSCHEARASAQAHDEKAAKELWELSENLVKATP